MVRFILARCDLFVIQETVAAQCLLAAAQNIKKMALALAPKPAWA
jgi:hypothetical protein